MKKRFLEVLTITGILAVCAAAWVYVINYC